MRSVKLFSLLILITIAFSATTSKAGFFDFLSDDKDSKSSTVQGKEELSACGKAVDEFRTLITLARVCKKDSDCTVLDGTCPLGCKLYVTNTFEPIVKKRMTQIKQLCTASVCVSNCAKENIKTSCVHNRCQQSHSE